MSPRRSRRLALASGLSLAILLSLLCFVHVSSEQAFHRTYARVEAGERAATGAFPSLDRGRHLVTAIAQCTFCHGTDLGGRAVADDPWIGRIDSANLTRGAGGVGTRYSRADWVNALRHGLRPDGTSLLLMPAGGLSRIAPEDLDAMLAYLDQVPPIDRAPRATRVGWLTRVAVAVGAARDIFSAQEARSARTETRSGHVPPREAPTADYGEYLVALGNCRVCHKADLRGGLHPLALPDEPPPPPLVGRDAMVGWTVQDFSVAMREGRAPDGQRLDREYMPWPGYSALDDIEIAALWAFLRQDEAPIRLIAQQ